MHFLKFIAFSIHDVCVNIPKVSQYYAYICAYCAIQVCAQMCAFMQCLIVCVVAWIVCTPVVQYVQCSITHCRIVHFAMLHAK